MLSFELHYNTYLYCVYCMCTSLKGLHPRLVTEGFELAKDKALEVRFSSFGLFCTNVLCNC